MAADVVLLDTHALLWWLAADRRLSARARGAIETASAVLVGSITFWEVGMLAGKGRIDLDRPLQQWAHDVVQSGAVEEVPVTAAIAALASELAAFHGDPADRMLVASAVARRAALVTKDRTIRQWARSTGQLACVW